MSVEKYSGCGLKPDGHFYSDKDFSGTSGLTGPLTHLDTNEGLSHFHCTHKKCVYDDKDCPMVNGVHISHCCVLHGCKYSNDECPVVLKYKMQEHPCFECQRAYDDGDISSMYAYQFTRFQKKLHVMMDIAKKFASLSTCSRKQVGTIITTPKFSKIVSVGYNGNYAGGENACESKKIGACGCAHSEISALVKFNPDYGNNFIMFCTLAPCRNCAKQIINISSAISTIIYDEDYRLTDGIDLLKTIPHIHLYKLEDLAKINNLTKFPHEL